MTEKEKVANRTVSTTLQLPVPVSDALKAKAAKIGISKADYMRVELSKIAGVN